MGADQEEKTKNPTQGFQYYSTDVVQGHNSENDAWIIVSGGVYNVTKFLKLHPGGKEVMLKHLGKDATEVFFSETEHAHSAKALRMLSHYHIGALDSAANFRAIPESPLSKLIDLQKPVLHQVMKMDPKDYHPWLNIAHSASQTITIFTLNWMEKLSRWPWWYIFPLWIPVILAALFTSLFQYNNKLHWVVMNFLMGLLSWGALEYVLHRWFFHITVEGTWANFYHFFIHGIHHLTPLDTTRLTFPPWFAVVIALGIYSTGMKFIATWTAYHAWFAGLVTGYVLYDTLHYYFHHGTSLHWVGYLQRMRTRHLRHHYKNPNKNFGVTSPLFDYIFGTNDSE